MVAFNLFPSNVRTPTIGVEFATSLVNAGPAQLPYNALIIGQKLSTGTAAVDTVVPCTSIADAITAGGRGSILHREAIGWFASNQSTALFLGVLADNGAGVAPTGTIVVTGPATESRTLSLYFGAVLVSVGVTVGDASTAIATNIAAAVTANPDLPITAVAASSTITFTFRHKGEVGNAYDIRANYNGEKTPAGVGLTITAMGGVVAGTGNPVLTSLIAGMATQWFQIWAHPYKDATSLTAIETELLSRAGPLRAIDGVAITSAVGSFSTLATLGLTRNSVYSEIIAQPGANPLTPPMEFAAETAALIAGAASIDPARPFNTLRYLNAVAVAAIDEFTQFPQRNLLLFDGIATSRQLTGAVMIDRAITTFQTNPSGQADATYLDVTTPLTLMLLRFRFRVFMSRFSRHKLAQDGTRFGPGQLVMTPALAKGEALTWYSDAITDGLAQDMPTFKAGLDAVINSTDHNRLDFALPVTLIGQLEVIGAQIQFGL
ncbi:MAG: phage tail protein [Actinomycetota bacterium]